MKVSFQSHIFFASISILTIKLPFSVNGYSAAPVLDIKQFSGKDLIKEDIQWDIKTNNTIQLRSAQCKNFAFPIEETDVTYIQLLFNTTVLRARPQDYPRFVEVSVECRRDKRTNQQDFQLPPFNDLGLSANTDFTRMTVYVGKCRHYTTGSRVINQIGLKFYAKKKKHSIKYLKDISPFPDANCETITNFKVIYIPSIPDVDIKIEDPNPKGFTDYISDIGQFLV